MSRAAMVAGCALSLLVGCGSVATPPSGPSPRIPLPTDVVPAASVGALGIPRLNISTPLVPLGLDPDGGIQVPPVTSPEIAGWYSLGVVPGDVGPAVVVGHVNGGGRPGIFARLHELSPGDPVTVGNHRFIVYRVLRVSKDAFPTETVYGDTPGPELRLITCGGSFDRTAHSYRDNIIVFADARRSS